MKLIALTAILALLFIEADAQQAGTFYQKGKEYYERDQFREALHYFKKFIALDSSNAEVFKWRGNCYLDLNQLDSAKHDYEKALRLSPGMVEIYYNLGRVYAQKEQLWEAEQYLRKFIKARPNDADGLAKMAMIKRKENSDSSLYYLHLAYAMDSTDISVIKSLAGENYVRGNFSKAITFSMLVRVYNEHDKGSIEIIAYSYMRLGNYISAISWADSLIREDPGSPHNYALKYRCQILSNTRGNILDGPMTQPKFKEIKSENIKTLDGWLEDPNSRYAYNPLLTKFRQGQLLGLDEYFMLYFGFTTDSRYSPYGSAPGVPRESVETQDFQSIVRQCHEMLTKKDEFDPITYKYLAISQFKLGNMEAFEIAFRNYIGITESIFATGTGKSFHEAFIVNSPHHEYYLLDYLGLSSAEQSLVTHEGHNFDILRTKDADAEKEIYFNIDKPFTSLNSLFNKTDQKSKKKRNKKG